MQKQVFLIGAVTDQSVQRVIEDLQRATNSTEIATIELVLSSQGGSITSSYALANYVQLNPKPIGILVLDYCASAAMTILASCKIRKSHKDAVFMTHSAGLESRLVAVDILEEAKWRYERTFVQLIKYQLKHTTIPKSQWKTFYTNTNRYIASKEALKLGFVTELV